MLEDQVDVMRDERYQQKKELQVLRQSESENNKAVHRLNNKSRRLENQLEALTREKDQLEGLLG